MALILEFLLSKIWNTPRKTAFISAKSVLKVLIKTNVLKCELSEDFADKDEEFIVKEAQLSDCIGKTFKQASESLGLDFAVVKEKFELKKGATQAKVKQEHLEAIKELLTV